MRRLLVIAVLILAVPAAAGRAAVPPTVSSDFTITMSDGVNIAATVVEPEAITHPLPAILMLHGLGGNRQTILPLAQIFAQNGFVVLAPDFRGHGQSGGLVSIDGPREIQDVRELVTWLGARPEVDRTHVGGWGISLGGGAILRALVEKVPFAAVETVETWTDLYSALAPQNEAKSGAIYGFASSVPSNRLAPEVKAIIPDAMRSRNLAALRKFAAIRSSRQLLSTVTTPVFMFQGRRDFAFDTAQAKAAMRLLRGPHRLYVGDFGHSPSTFPGPDIDRVMTESISWFGIYLQGLPHPVGSQTPVELASDPWRAATLYRGLPPTRSVLLKFNGSGSMRDGGKVVLSRALSRRLYETFGAGVVRVSGRFTRGWERLVAVLTATTPNGDEILVSEGGANTRGFNGRHRVSIRLIDDVTTIPRGSRLTLTLAAASTAEDPNNLLYLDLPMRIGARATVGHVSLTLPVLRRPVSQ